MKYVDRYIYAVTRHLPEKDREEVSRELRSNIEDMLMEDYSEDNIKQVLEEMGSPYELSSQYLDQEKYLIGPRMYHSYVDTLRILLTVALIVGAVIFTVDLLISLNSLDAINSLTDIINIIVGIIASGISIMFNVVVGFFFWVTLGFIIAERTSAADEIKNFKNKVFVVEDLKEIPKTIGKKISKVEMTFSLISTMAFLSILLLRSDLIAIYIAGEGSYPIFNERTIKMYLILILAVGALSIILTIYKIILGRWNKKLAVAATIYALISLMVTIIVVLDPHLFDPKFITFMSDNFKTWSIDFSQNMGKFKVGFLVVASIITLIDIVTALYQGFRRENTLEKFHE